MSYEVKTALWATGSAAVVLLLLVGGLYVSFGDWEKDQRTSTQHEPVRQHTWNGLPVHVPAGPEGQTIDLERGYWKLKASGPYFLKTRWNQEWMKITPDAPGEENIFPTGNTSVLFVKAENDVTVQPVYSNRPFR